MKSVKLDLKLADDLVSQLKRIYQEGYSKQVVEIAKKYSILVKNSLNQLHRSSNEFKDFRQGLQSNILDYLSKPENGSRFAGTICCAIICEISSEIFVEYSIISNRLRDMIREFSMRRFVKKQTELAELLSHVFGTYFGKQFEKATHNRFDEIHDALYNEDEKLDMRRREFSKYHACLVIKYMVSHAPGYYYRNISRNEAIIKTIESLFILVREFKDSEEMRLAALTALRSLIDLISYREIYKNREAASFEWQAKIVQLILDGLSGDINDGSFVHSTIGSILVTYQLLDIIPPSSNNLLGELESTYPYPKTHPEWNPANEKNKTEKFFHQVFINAENGDDKVETEVRETKKYSDGASKVLSGKFKMLMNLIIRQRKCRNNHWVHPYLVPLLPKLAAFNPKMFEDEILEDVVEYCISEIMSKENRNSALLTLGLVVYLVSKSGSLIFSKKNYLQKIIGCFKDVIEDEGCLSEDQRVQRLHPVNPQLFKSLNLITVGIGLNPNINLHSLRENNSIWKSKENRYFLNLVMAAGFVRITEDWMQAVQNLNTYIETEQVAAGVEQILLHILLDINFPSNVSNERSADHACLSTILNRDAQFYEKTIDRKVMAFKTLENFEFKDARRYLQFIERRNEEKGQTIPERYLSSKENILVRIAATKCLAKIMKPFLFDRSQLDIPLSYKISIIIKTMLISADLVPADAPFGTDFKLTIYQSLDSEFDDYLVHNNNLERMLNAIHQPYPKDNNQYTERLQVQKSVMKIIGRLNTVNAAETMPQIRNMMRELWKEIENSNPGVCRPAASLLQVLFENANQAQASLFVEPTLQLIMPILKQENNDKDKDEVICTLIDCVASMAAVDGGPINHDWMLDIFETIIPMLSEAYSPCKRLSTLKCIGELAEYHSYVVSVYKNHIKLMPSLLMCLLIDKDHDVHEKTLQVLGRFGAISPFQCKELLNETISVSKNDESSASDYLDINEMLVSENKRPDEKFNIRVTIECIRKKLAENDEINDIFLPLAKFEHIIQVAGTDILPYLKSVMPELHRIVRSCRRLEDTDLVTNVLSSFEKLVKQMRRRILPYMQDIVTTMESQWLSESTKVQKKLAELVYHSAAVLQYEFKDYLTKVIQLIIQMFERLRFKNNDEEREPLKKLVEAIPKFGPIHEYFNFIIKPLAEMLQSPHSSKELKLDILNVLIERVAIDAMPDYFMILNEALLEMLRQTMMRNAGPNPVREKALEVLDLMKWAMMRSDQWSVEYDAAIEARLEAMQGFSKGRTQLRKWIQGEKPERSEPRSLAKASDYTDDINRHKNTDKAYYHEDFSWLKDAFDAKSQVTPEDYTEWLEFLCNQCLIRNPSNTLKTLQNLGNIKDNKVHFIVFNAAFYTIWKDPNDFIDGGLSQPSPQNQTSGIDKYREHIIRSLSSVIKAEQVPDQVHSIFLDLANFIEHCDADKESLDTFGNSLKAFGGWTGIRALGDCAEKIAAFPKALHYREMEFLRCLIVPEDETENKTRIAESLINIYSKLNVQEAAEGVLDYANSNNINVSPQWYEKLNHWEGAKERYYRAAESEENKLGYMRCLEALGEWDELQIESQQYLSNIPDEPSEAVKRRRKEAARLGTISSWQKENWTAFEHTMNMLPTDEFDGSFFQAVNYVRKLNFDSANKFIRKARLTLQKNIAKNIHQYSRAYPDIYNAQLLSELEEVMCLKQVKGSVREPARRQQIQKMWELRLIGTRLEREFVKMEGVRPSIEDWQKILLVRSLDQVINRRNRNDVDAEDMAVRPMLKFVSLARKQGRSQIAAQTIRKMLPGIETWNIDQPYNRIDSVSTTKLTVLYKHIKHNIIPNEKIDKGIQIMKSFAEGVGFNECRLNDQGNILYSRIYSRQAELNRKFLSSRRHFYTSTDANVMGEFTKITEETRKKYESAIEKLKVGQIKSPSFVNRKYKVVHCFATFALDCVEYWRDHDRDLKTKTQNQLLKLKRNAANISGVSGLSKASSEPQLINDSLATDQNSISEHSNSQSTEYPWPIPAVTNNMRPRVVTMPGNNTDKIKENSKVIRSSFHQHIREYSLLALKYFYMSVNLSPKSVLQDMLRILKIMADFNKDVEERENDSDSAFDEYRKRMEFEIRAGYSNCDPERWLKVIPQLIAIMDMKHVDTQAIFCAVGEQHAQGILFSLIFASKNRAGGKPEQRKVAKDIIEKIRDHSKNLVEEAELLSKELVSVSMLWSDIWLEAMEFIANQWYQDMAQKPTINNIRILINRMLPLHDMINKRAKTMDEIEFRNRFASKLEGSEKVLKVLLNKINTQYADIHPDRDIPDLKRDVYTLVQSYHDTKGAITNKQKNISRLNLKKVSPRMLESKNMEIIIPGTYDPNSKVIRIEYIAPEISVITSSKQKPKTLDLIGSDGRRYKFLLKGKEDLRLDERVMQLFDLMNNLINLNDNLRKKNLEVIKYNIIPMTNEFGHNGGLIRWIEDSDPINTLLKKIRGRLGVDIFLEKNQESHRKPQDAPAESLSIIQKIEQFQYVQETTKNCGYHLAKSLWLGSASAEIWFEKRTNFSRSLALMSMVGYILGLGDRHVSNILIISTNGKVAHIDFGDSFEAAVQRENVPEKVPFRLTRMLVKAMEVNGVNGTFKKICRESMKMCRNNKESILAVLEAFVQDPVVLESQKTRRKRMVLTRGTTEQADGQVDADQREEIFQEGKILRRVQDKLDGKDFNNLHPLTVNEQVDNLIREAQNMENLCQHYHGWCIHY